MRSWDPRTRAGALSWLLVACGVYAVVAFALSEVRYLELHATAWDLGLYQQSLWSTSHGRPFYESGDFEELGIASVLEIHTSFVLYPLVPVYAVFPDPTWLFALQAVAVAAAAVPLYGVGRNLALPPERSLALATLYLAFVPVLSGNLYDFHVEAFVPVEMFTFLWLWMRGRYGEGAAIALLGFATLEVSEIFVALIALFFLLPPLRSSLLDAYRSVFGPDAQVRKAARRALAAAWGGCIRSLRGRASFGLLVASLLAFVLLRAAQAFLLPGLLGTSAPPEPDGFLIGGSSSILAPSWANLVFLIPRGEYWALLFLLAGGLPLLAPRSAILIVPWMGFTILSDKPQLTTLGYQYGMLTAIPLLIGAAYGLQRLPQLLPRLAPRPPVVGGRGDERPPQPRGRIRGRAVGRSVTLFGVLFVGVVAANLLLSPIDPWVQGYAGSQGYDLSYDLDSGFDVVRSVAGLVPASATVLSSDDLFPFVANDIHAYVLDPNTTSGYVLPFNGSELPPFVLLSQERIFEVPAWLSDTLYNRSDYGLRAMGFQTSDGAVALFEAGYRGPTETWDAPLGPYSYSPSALWLGGSAERQSDPQAPQGEVIEGLPGATGVLWFGPYSAIPAGNYTIAVTVRALSDVPHEALPPDTPVLEVDSSGFATPTYLDSTVLDGVLPSSGFTTLSYNVTLPEAAMNFEVRGYALNVSAEVELAGVAVTPTS